MTKLQEHKTNYLGKKYRYNMKTVGFLVYFLPLFLIKMIGMDITDRVGQTVTIVAIVLSITIMKRLYMSKTIMFFWGAFLFIGAITIFTTGKFSIFFSIYTLFLLRQLKIENYSQIYKVLTAVGVIILCITIYQYLDKGEVQTRYMNNGLKEITKRANFIYVSYFTIMNLYILYRRKHRIILFCIVYLITGYLMFRYSGSRSGLICVAIECLLLLIVKIKIYKRKIVKCGFIISPFLLFGFDHFINWGYGRYDLITKLNLMLQNRLRYGKLFLSTYHPTLFGQKIDQSYATETYQVLDNAFLSLYLIYGIIVTLLWLLLNCGTIKYLFESKRYEEVAVIVSYMIYGLTECFIFVSFISMTFFLYSEYINTKIIPKRKVKVEYLNTE